jgi:hypothetical protein
MEQATRNKERGFRRLRAWQKADELACAVFRHFLRGNDIIDGEKLAPIEVLRAETGSLLFGLTQSLRDKLREDGPWQRGLIREDVEEYFLAAEE